tara:strand:+ start:7925 stop:8227 length:303 start_codon:yes stop_codon:yes gene_type:complete
MPHKREITLIKKGDVDMRRAIEYTATGGIMLLLAYLLVTIVAMETLTPYIVHWFDSMIAVLNWQPFGDHGVNSLLSIRMVHILGTVAIWRTVGKQISKTF